MLVLDVMKDCSNRARVQAQVGGLAGGGGVTLLASAALRHRSWRPCLSFLRWAQGVRRLCTSAGIRHLAAVGTGPGFCRRIAGTVLISLGLTSSGYQKLLFIGGRVHVFSVQYR